MKKLFLILTLALIITGCSDVRVYDFRHDIIAVYMHEVGRYSVTIKTGDELKMTKLPWMAKVRIFNDVAPGKSMWYMCNATYDSWGGATTGGCEIHIRNVDAINGAGWNHGKFGSGTTERVF